MNKEEEKFLKQNQTKPINNVYYWITTIVNGKTIICGCKSSESEAEGYCYEKNLEPYKIYPLRTKDINAASRMIRGHRLNEGEQIQAVMQRFKRKL
jgi:hypothetical protein